ncbi:hypothetical protein CCH79_00018692, partial [Gambusia affinis]
MTLPVQLRHRVVVGGADVSVDANGLLEVIDTFDRPGDAYTEDTYARTGTYAIAGGEDKPGKRVPKAGAYAEAGVGKARAEYSVFEAEARGPNASAGAGANPLGASAFARAELAGASAAAGPLKVKVGLAADTGVSVGAHGLEAKVLGTGFTIGERPSVSIVGNELECCVFAAFCDSDSDRQDRLVINAFGDFLLEHSAGWRNCENLQRKGRRKHHTALQDGETAGTFTEKEGGNITVRCEFRYSGTKRFLCKETCEGENILIETTKDRDNNGRFSIRYERRNIFSSDFLYVWITDLKPSDSGRYRCRSDETYDGTLYDHFDLVVTEDSSKPKWTPRSFIESTFIPETSTKTTIKTTTAATQSQSFSPSSETIKLSEKPAAASDPLLNAVLVLVVLIVSFAAALLIFFKRKNFSQQKGSSEETENSKNFQETCEEENILIESTEERDENERFSIRYERRRLYESDFLHVSITDLKLSDSGRYRCRSDTTYGGIRYDDFDLVVTEASTTTKRTIRTTTKRTIRTTTSTQSFSPSETIKLSEKPAAASDPLLYVGLSLAVLVVLLATALLIYCQRKRFHQQKGPPVKIDSTDFTTINTVYEEIREEDRQNKPPAGEISSVYVYVQPNKPNAAESNEIYSLASEPQGQAKEEDIEYSLVQLPNVAAKSNGGHLADSDDVTYSEP